MIKKTLYLSQNAKLSLDLGRIKIESPTRPQPTFFTLEDVGVLLLESPQVLLTSALLSEMMNRNVAVITCDDRHLPNGYMMPLSGHYLQGVRFKAQIEAGLPLKKRLWQQTIKQKISNQAQLLHKLGFEVTNMKLWEESVKSGDPDNYEARAAAYYFSVLFQETEVEFFEKFKRERYGEAPNNFLNYGYAILRAVVARGLVGSGLLPTLGIFHKNQYNAYCLADDIMEPYRPVVDALVYSMVEDGLLNQDLTKEHKQKLLTLVTADVLLGEETFPLMIALQRTTASLAKCYLGEEEKITYPKLYFPKKK